MDAWFQCASGASGDMLLGALVSAGASIDAIRAGVDAVGVEPIALEVSAVRRGGMAATKVDVVVAESHHHRTWTDVDRLLQAAGPGLGADARDLARAVFARLAAAEARMHGMPVEDVHFHEVGALDSIADVVGVCVAVRDLALDRIGADAVAVGSGMARTSHGRIGVPVPAVVDLLAEVEAPIRPGVVERELCTPTGAALLAELVDVWGPVPAMQLAGHGVGAGTADPVESPNVLRVLFGEFADAPSGPRRSEIVTIAANVDDLDPRVWPEVLMRLLDAGADDAWLTPIVMKKGRPAHTVQALVAPERAAAVRETLYRETSTIGVREWFGHKHALSRDERVVMVHGHSVRVKDAWLRDELVNTQPELDDVAAVAAAVGLPLRRVLQDAVTASRQGDQGPRR